MAPWLLHGVRSRKLSNVGQSLDGWPKNLLSRAPLCFRRHVKPLACICNQHPPIHWARVVGYGPFSLCVIHKACAPVGTLIRWWWWWMVIKWNLMWYAPACARVRAARAGQAPAATALLVPLRTPPVALNAFLLICSWYLHKLCKSFIIIKTPWTQQTLCHLCSPGTSPNFYNNSSRFTPRTQHTPCHLCTPGTFTKFVCNSLSYTPGTQHTPCHLCTPGTLTKFVCNSSRFTPRTQQSPCHLCTPGTFTKFV
jgi:hypothetical protein